MTDEERRLASPVTAHVPGVVIPSGVDDTYQAAPIVPAARRDRVVVALTRLHPAKRIDALIRAFHAAALSSEFDEWRLAIAGQGEADYTAELQRLAATGPAAGRIDFMGWLAGDGKREWLSRAAILAMPSHQENFGLGLVEGLARGVPAIVSRAVNLSPLIESVRAGWVVGSDDSDLRDTLMVAMRDDVDREARSGAARALAARFTWAETAAQLEGLYRSLRVVPVGGSS